MRKVILALLVFAGCLVSCSKDSSGSSSAVTGEATEITATSATISGQAIIKGTSTGEANFGVLYSTESILKYDTANKVQAKEYDSSNKFTVQITGLSPNTTYYYCTYNYQNKEAKCGKVKSFQTTNMEAIDLGLSVKWASCNIGASKPEDYGKHFAWGDVVGQSWNGSKWSGGGFSSAPSYKLDANNNLKPAYDAAHVLLGGNWRMPTKEDMEELRNNCTCTFTSNYNKTGVSGLIFTSKKSGYTNKSIFLPAAGNGYKNILSEAGTKGWYWTAAFNSDDTAFGIFFISGSLNFGYTYRYYGLSIRPVTE